MAKSPHVPIKTTFQHLKWKDAVDYSIHIQRVKRKEGGRDVWYYIEQEKTISRGIHLSVHKKPFPMSAYTTKLHCYEHYM